MAHQGHPLLLLAWLATCLALASGETRYEKFLRQHVDYPESSAPDARTYCSQMMQRRGLASSTCKFTNSFVHAPAATISTICGSGGAPASGDLRDSNAAFAVTTCRLQGGSQKPPCRYNADVGTHRIRIACQEGLPVHYDRSL
uniref:Ribonuclease n=1 Tax=Pelodiscus sinensis TaxID=13735 RepID=K7EX26_PELSI|nr:ribonuclease-like [Pelodiscus sinensis]|eukprot:XP_006113899.1 ribonuclease-like [Pelodiscus sinensis]